MNSRCIYGRPERPTCPNVIINFNKIAEITALDDRRLSLFATIEEFRLELDCYGNNSIARVHTKQLRGI